MICVRDRESEHVAREHLADRVLLAPDMAHYLWPVPHSKPVRRNSPYFVQTAKRSQVRLAGSTGTLPS
ncbi:MAG: hypothetical protein L0Y67_05085, partial [Gammaproteobacteria bacterium]|nr:hypothetical protein [Gammaproteobacteria bacterium]